MTPESKSITIQVHPSGVFYIQFSKAKVDRTVKVVEDALLVDVDGDGNVLGIEILDPKDLARHMDQIRETYRLPKEASCIDFEHLEKTFAGVGA